MRQTCCICGREDDELFMYPIQTSRVRWLCGSCYKKADNEVAGTLNTRRRAKWVKLKKREAKDAKQRD